MADEPKPRRYHARRRAPAPLQLISDGLKQQIAAEPQAAQSEAEPLFIPPELVADLSYEERLALAERVIGTLMANPEAQEVIDEITRQLVGEIKPA
jgi:hypothetical protein